jgi:biofilm PGA synthesis N-glycosyltransferase PgaC
MGYRTWSIPDPELRISHLRLMGSSDRNIYRGRLRWGKGQHYMGSAFLYVLASGLFRMHEKPYAIGGILIVVGYLMAALRREPRYGDPEFRRELRSWQYRRLRRLFSSRSAR